MLHGLRLTLIAVAAATPGAALAHTGVGGSHGLVHGFMHPVGGLDHVLAMVAVGLFAAGLATTGSGGRALWAVPLAFMAAMAAGGALGAAGFALPYVEFGIALSVVVLGLAVTLRWHWPVAAAMALVAMFAVFHGYAHGAEMPPDAAGLAYAVGFLAATGLLHLAGIGFGYAATRLGQHRAVRAAQFSGTAIALAGVALLVRAV